MLISSGIKLNTKVFELYRGKYRNLVELAHTMGISGGYGIKLVRDNRSDGKGVMSLRN